MWMTYKLNFKVTRPWNTSDRNNSLRLAVPEKLHANDQSTSLPTAGMKETTLLVLIFVSVLHASHAQTSKPQIVSVVHGRAERVVGGERCGRMGQGQCLPGEWACLATLTHTQDCPTSHLCCLGGVPSGERNRTRKRTMSKTERQQSQTRNLSVRASGAPRGELVHFGNATDENKHRKGESRKKFIRGSGKTELRKVHGKKSRTGMLKEKRTNKQKKKNYKHMVSIKQLKKDKTEYKTASKDKQYKMRLKKKIKTMNDIRQERNQNRETPRKLSLNMPKELENSHSSQDILMAGGDISRAKQRACRTRSRCKKRGGSCKKSCKRWQSSMKGKGCKGKRCRCCVPECKPRRHCKKKGGSCQKLCSADERAVRAGCGGSGCRCCLPSKICIPKASCSEREGICKSKCEDTEVVVANGCFSKGCFCCAPESSICHSAPTCPGHCTHTCQGVVLPAHCIDKECICCLDCSPTAACKSQHGRCKTECSCGEQELPHGCLGDGCKCCVAYVAHCSEKTATCHGKCIFWPLCTGVIRSETCEGEAGCACCAGCSGGGNEGGDGSVLLRLR